MLTCEDCGSHEVVMAGLLTEGADVCCSECGLVLGTYPAFFACFAEGQVPRKSVDRASGRDPDGPVASPDKPGD